MTSNIPRGAVVCGVDGSPGSDAALACAAELAQLEHRPLHVLHAERIPVVFSPALVTRQLDNLPALVRDASQRTAGAAVTQVRSAYPSLQVSSSIRDADARDALGAASRHASTLVVGSRGLGGMSSLLLGSVSVWISQHAACPTLVVRPGPERPDAPIMVGTDTTEVSTGALEFAFAFASLRRRPLVVVHCLEDHYLGGYGLIGVPDEDLEDLPSERLAIGESVAGLREKYVDVDVGFELGRGPAAAYLSHASTRASLMVVGSRQRSTPAAVLSGSVSRTVVEHAKCTVAVVPART